MILYIDTSNKEKTIIAINQKRYTITGAGGSSQKLLSSIDKILKRNHLTPKDIKEIKVNTGPGSFTGIRVGVAVANAFGYALNIPVNKRKTELEIKY
jgi:tRNA threonylcarbamoyladenosine biosynthesis protein TsaB